MGGDSAARHVEAALTNETPRGRPAPAVSGVVAVALRLIADAAEGERGGYRLEGGGRDGNADHWGGAAFVGFHSRAIRCASAI